MICPECNVECFCWYPSPEGYDPDHPLICGCCHWELKGESSHRCPEYLGGAKYNGGITNTYNDPFKDDKE